LYLEARFRIRHLDGSSEDLALSCLLVALIRRSGHVPVPGAGAGPGEAVVSRRGTPRIGRRAGVERISSSVWRSRTA